MPASNKELRLSRINFKENYTNLAVNPQTFETLKNLTIYAKNRNLENKLFGILLHDERSSAYSITITAEKGNIAMERNILDKNLVAHLGLKKNICSAELSSIFFFGVT